MTLERSPSTGRILRGMAGGATRKFAPNSYAMPISACAALAESATVAASVGGSYMQFPSVCPEIPVSSLPQALAYYRDQLGFNIDWSAQEIGLACLSRGDTRMFMSTDEYRSV